MSCNILYTSDASSIANPLLIAVSILPKLFFVDRQPVSPLVTMSANCSSVNIMLLLIAKLRAYNIKLPAPGGLSIVFTPFLSKSHTLDAGQSSGTL